MKFQILLTRRDNLPTRFFLTLTSDPDDGNMVTMIMMIVALEQAGGPAHFIMPRMKGRVGEQGTGWDIVMIAMGM